ncbi:hypothetical protein B0H17DRAFT_1060234, partial [Mycena rosella]
MINWALAWWGLVWACLGAERLTRERYGRETPQQLHRQSRIPQVKYCSLCNAYFYSEEMLKAHIKGSSRHPKCHYVLSTRHHFCRDCEKHFKTIGALRIHLDFAHLDSDTEDGPTRPDGWEDQQALAEDAALGGEIPIPPETLFALTIGLAALTLRKSTTCTGVLRPNCPICFSGRKVMCATRCGHVFRSG